MLQALYLATSELNRRSYERGWRQRHRLPGKTWSIGNLAVGGTGKSPVTMALATMLVESGRRPAILTRGYGVPLRRGDSVVLLAGDVVLPASSTARLPDEARMQSALLPTVPVIAGPDRFRAAQRYMTDWQGEAPSHWLLDDGFQHWALHRDFDLVLLDATNPLPDLLPTGRARERPEALRRAHMVMFTRCTANAPSPAAKARVRSFLHPEVPLLRSTMSTVYPTLSCDGLTSFDTKIHTPCCLVSGIAQPEAWRSAIAKLGIEVGCELTLRDHAAISSNKLLECSQGQRSILTTAKDYWRDPEAYAGLSVPVFIAPLQVSWDESAVREGLRQYW